MKTKEQIEARLKEAREELTRWRQDVEKAYQNEQEDYREYCINIVRETKAQIELLTWILHP